MLFHEVEVESAFSDALYGSLEVVASAPQGSPPRLKSGSLRPTEQQTVCDHMIR